MQPQYLTAIQIEKKMEQLNKMATFSIQYGTLLGPETLLKTFGNLTMLKEYHKMELETYLTSVKDGLPHKPTDQVKDLIYNAFDDNFERIAKMKEIGII